MRLNNIVLLSSLLFPLWTPAVFAEIDVMTGLECVDNHEQCPFWAATGECKKNPRYMGKDCRLSCERCHIVRVNNQNEINAFLESKRGEIEQKLKASEALNAIKAEKKDEL